MVSTICQTTRSSASLAIPGTTKEYQVNCMDKSAQFAQYERVIMLKDLKRVRFAVTGRGTGLRGGLKAPWLHR